MEKKVEAQRNCLPIRLIYPPDIDPLQIPPLWPPKAADVQVEEGAYDPRAVPITSICFVTEKIIKVSILYSSFMTILTGIFLRSMPTELWSAGLIRWQKPSRC